MRLSPTRLARRVLAPVLVICSILGFAGAAGATNWFGVFAGPAHNGSLAEECGKYANSIVNNGAFGLDYVEAHTGAFFTNSGTCSDVFNAASQRLGLSIFLFKDQGGGSSSLCNSTDPTGDYWNYNGSSMSDFGDAVSRQSNSCSTGNYYGFSIHRYKWANGTTTTSAAYYTSVVNFD